MANLDNIIVAIDSRDAAYLYKQALADPVGVIRKISIRQLGRKRISSLYSLIKGMDHDKLMANSSFFLLVENLCVNELGFGFGKGNKKKSITSSEDSSLTKPTEGESVS